MWLPINENYEVSIEGQVRNKKFNRILKPYLCGKYLGLRMGNSKSHKYYIHRLVAITFLPFPTDEGCVVDHIDRDKLNNHASNLRWVSKTVNSLNRTLEMKARPNNLTGEHHIKKVSDCKAGTDYIVVFDTDTIKHYSYHKSLSDAIKSRDNIIQRNV